tara:strand:- start:1854 stop:2120 length:267 start_codon:yes stop_codon:yes gene_type:complete
MIKINNKRMQKVIESRIEESARTISRLINVINKKLITMTEKEIMDIVNTEAGHQHKNLIKDFAVYKNKIKEEFIRDKALKLYLLKEDK